eukprot:CAMPEP_0171344442 /NCGR_PEP_ID=MMETSP0878-20121228/19380_1 /TAXON_ID=67004 /ORGANISM="Thalassiosira weissflogii, Strain CCMP1336" /LENGTH=402 /DNA_ID=CAMNT_0011847629 /DNA_START=128 /DNA_END=1336 /DNA_ORIENTATION=+
MGSTNGYYDELHIRHPFLMVFFYSGTVWPLVLPYCCFNVFLLTALTVLKNYWNISISILPQGHALMSLLIAYLGVSKVNLAYERYMSAQIATGHAFLILRELHQLSITMTENFENAEAIEWRRDTRQTIIQLVHETVTALRDGKHAAALARNVGYRLGVGIDGSKVLNSRGGIHHYEDPMILVHALRSHLYNESAKILKGGDGVPELQLLERCKMIDLLHEFTVSYRNLVRLASSPLPFVLVQMGRTFIFIWTLTIPLVLTGADFVQEYPSAFFFVILLTYGFLGLEFLSRMLSNPFGDEIKNDLNVRGMGTAAIIGIKEDAGLSEMNNLQGNRSTATNATTGSLRGIVQKRQESIRKSARYARLDSGRKVDAVDEYSANSFKYCEMDESAGNADGFPVVFS